MCPFLGKNTAFADLSRRIKAYMFVISEFGLYGGNQEIMSHAKLSKCPSKLGSTEVPYTIYQISTGPVVLEKILYNFYHIWARWPSWCSDLSIPIHGLFTLVLIPNC